MRLPPNRAPHAIWTNPTSAAVMAPAQYGTDLRQWACYSTALPLRAASETCMRTARRQRFPSQAVGRECEREDCRSDRPTWSHCHFRTVSIRNAISF